MVKTNNLFILPFIILFLFFYKLTVGLPVADTLEKSARADMQKLVNYSRMTDKAKETYIKQRIAQYKSWNENKIPENFRIPIELQSYRPEGVTKFYVIYNTVFKTGVGYVPSNLVRHYEEEAWRAYSELGKDAPSLSIVLGQQFTESAFNPYALGDSNMSIGLPQLYRKTARELYKKDKNFWKDLYSFNKKGQHNFKNIQSQIRFPFVFLPKVKNYTMENKQEALQKYNGAGQDAMAYAEKVMLRSLLYEELFATFNTIPLDTTGYKDNLYGMINLTLLYREGEMLSHATLDQIFSNVLTVFSTGYVRNTYLQHYRIMQMETKPLDVSIPKDFVVPVSGEDFYLIIEDGRTLYSYFRDAETMYNVISNPKNKDYYIYTKSGKKKVIIKNLKQLKGKNIYSNVVPGDKIYIPPGTVLNNVKTNMAIFIQ